MSPTRRAIGVRTPDRVTGDRVTGDRVTGDRIRGIPVPPLIPDSGPVWVLLVGEAPGPRGADKSGVPFFGDAAGTHLYQVLRAIGAVSLPEDVDTLPWDGATFAAKSIVPIANGVALGNAYDTCPTDDGRQFRTPTRRELESPENVRRLQRDITSLQARGLRGIVTMGRVATMTLDVVCAEASLPSLIRCAVPHPSAQGLLSVAPNRGRGARMSDLQEEWKQRCRQAIVDAGYEGVSGATSTAHHQAHGSAHSNARRTDANQGAES